MKKITDLQLETADNLLVEAALANFENELNALVEKHSSAIGAEHSAKVKNTILESLKTRKNIIFESEDKRPENTDIGDKKISKMASEIVGDGKSPNKFFIIVGDEYMFDGEEGLEYYSEYPDLAPVKLEKMETKTLGPFDDIDDAMNEVDNIELDGKNGPRTVTVEDRTIGQVYEKSLKAKQTIKWDEIYVDDRKMLK